MPAEIDLDCVRVVLPDDAGWQARDSAVLDALLYLEEAKTSFGLSSSNPVPLLHFEGGLQFSGESLPFTDISFSAALSLSLAGPLVQTGAKAAWQRNRTGAEAIEQGVNLSTVPDPALVLAQQSAERVLSRARQGLERARAAACLSRQRACSQWALAQRSSSVSLRRLAREEASQAESRLLLEQGHLSTGDWLSQELSLEEARIKALDARFDLLLAALELVPSLADIAGMLLFPDPKEET